MQAPAMSSSLRLVRDFCGLGSFCLSFRGLRSSRHLRLLEADQQPGLRRVRAKVHEATGNILSQILQARFDDCVVGSDSPSNPLRLFIYLAGDRRLLPAQRVLVSTAHHPILINRKLEKHVSIAFLLLCQSPDSKRQPVRLLAWFRWRWCGRLCGRFVCQRYCLVCILRRACRPLTIHINVIPLIDHIDAIIVNGGLIGRLLDCVYREESSSGCQGGGTPPPPGIATIITSSVPTRVPHQLSSKLLSKLFWILLFISVARLLRKLFTLSL